MAPVSVAQAAGEDPATRVQAPVCLRDGQAQVAPVSVTQAAGEDPATRVQAPDSIWMALAEAISIATANFILFVFVFFNY